MKCLKCDHQWKPEVEVPVRCPRCKTSSYMYPPGVGLSRGKEFGNGGEGLGDAAKKVASQRIPPRVPIAVAVVEEDAKLVCEACEEVLPRHKRGCPNR
jgi:Zn finger protein HypA/HybF involved in hydrogenase expression